MPSPTDPAAELSEEECDAIRRRSLDAMLGPWSSHRTAHDHLWTIRQCAEPHPEAFAIAKVAPDDWSTADFIAHARTDIPRLLSTVARLRARLAAIEGAVDAVLDATKPRDRDHWRDGEWTECSVCSATTCRGGVLEHGKIYYSGDHHPCFYPALVAARLVPSARKEGE